MAKRKVSGHIPIYCLRKANGRGLKINIDNRYRFSFYFHGQWSKYTCLFNLTWYRFFYPVEIKRIRRHTGEEY